MKTSTKNRNVDFDRGIDRIERSTMVWIILTVTIVSKIGDGIGLGLIESYPSFVLVLNANDIHCALTTTTLSIVPWFILATIRRMIEDPLYYWIGRTYRADALSWLKCKIPHAEKLLRGSETHFRRGSYAAIVVNPGMLVCCVAGATRVPPAIYLSLNALGVLLRLIVIRAVCAMFPGQVDAVLNLIQAYLPIVLSLAVLMSVFSAYRLYDRVGPWGRAKEPIGDTEVLHKRSE